MSVTVGAILDGSVGTSAGTGALGAGNGCGKLPVMMRDDRYSVAFSCPGGGLLVPWIVVVS